MRWAGRRADRGRGGWWCGLRLHRTGELGARITSLLPHNWQPRAGWPLRVDAAGRCHGLHRPGGWRRLDPLHRQAQIDDFLLGQRHGEQVVFDDNAPKGISRKLRVAEAVWIVPASRQPALGAGQRFPGGDHSGYGPQQGMAFWAYL